MKLVLGDGYPFPFPDDLSQDEVEELDANLKEEGIALTGVKSFEWRYTLTVQFIDVGHFTLAAWVTGWQGWGDASDLILEAKTSADDGREFPAVIVHDKAYCRIWLENDDVIS